jgi:hypothetical protein
LSRWRKLAESKSGPPGVGGPGRGLLTGLGLRGGPHPCEGTGGWPQRPGDGMGCPGGGSLLSPSLARPALAVRVAACLLARVPGGGPHPCEGTGGWPQRPGDGMGCPGVGDTVSPNRGRRVGRSMVVGLESGSMTGIRPGSACEAAVPGEWFSAEVDPSRFGRGSPGRLVRPRSRESGSWRRLIQVGLAEVVRVGL